MLESHNPDAIQEFGWSQIEPIQEEIVKEVLPKSPKVGVVILNIIPRYTNFAVLMIRNMTEAIANNIANANGIEILNKAYDSTEQTVLVNLIRSILTFQTSDRFIDVNGLFKLSKLSPQLQDMSLRKLEEISQIK